MSCRTGLSAARVRLVIGLVATAVAVSLPQGAIAAGKPSAEAVWVRQTLARMTLPEKVGQLFEVNGYGRSVRDHSRAMVKLNRRYYGVDNIAQLIAKYHLGGIIYFDWTNNLKSPSQIVRLSNGIQRVALRAPTRVPMVISADQEQGEVLRIGPPATVFPGSMALGATRSIGLARQAAGITGVELRAMGINVDNAPVLDVNIDPLNQADGIRAYGDRVAMVKKFGVAQVRAYQRHQSTTGVGATAKHWPGFGDSSINSDNGVAVSPQTLAEVKRINLPPFQAALRAGIDRVMVTHILYPKVTGSKIPTSLSSFWVNHLLRGSLHYRGPVVTDALDAAALNGFTPAQVALRALRAGDDELLEIAQVQVDKPPGDLISAYKAVLRAVKSGKVSKRRLDQSVTRILALKWKLGIVRHPFTRTSRVPAVVGTPKHLAVAQDAAARSITLLRNSAGVLPLTAGSGKKVLVTGFGQVTTATIGQQFSAHGLSPQVIDTGFSPTPSMITSTVNAANQSDVVVVATFNAWSSPTQLQLVSALLATHKPVVIAAVGTPYDVAYFPTATTFITSLDYQPASLIPLVKAMFGELTPSGKLPVTITEPPPSTNVLYPFGFGLPSFTAR